MSALAVGADVHQQQRRHTDQQPVAGHRLGLRGRQPDHQRDDETEVPQTRQSAVAQASAHLGQANQTSCQVHSGITQPAIDRVLQQRGEHEVSNQHPAIVADDAAIQFPHLLSGVERARASGPQGDRQRPQPGSEHRDPGQRGRATQDGENGGSQMHCGECSQQQQPTVASRIGGARRNEDGEQQHHDDAADPQDMVADSGLVGEQDVSGQRSRQGGEHIVSIEPERCAQRTRLDDHEQQQQRYPSGERA